MSFGTLGQSARADTNGSRPVQGDGGQRPAQPVVAVRDAVRAELPVVAVPAFGRGRRAGPARLRTRHLLGRRHAGPAERRTLSPPARVLPWRVPRALPAETYFRGP